MLHKSVNNNEIMFMRFIVVTIQFIFSTEKVLYIDFPYNDTFLPNRMKKEENHNGTQIQMQYQFNDKKSSSIVQNKRYKYIYIRERSHLNHSN